MSSQKYFVYELLEILTMNDIGIRVKLLRKEFELTQRDFANRILVTPSYLSRVENGTEVLSDKLIKLIIYEFGVNEDWLLSGEGKMLDEIYENDRETSSKDATKMLLKIMQLLDTDSNTTYASSVFAVSNAIDIIKYSKLFDEYNIDFLSEVGMLFANIALCLSFKRTYPDDEVPIKHIEEVLDSLKKCCNTINRNSG